MKVMNRELVAPSRLNGSRKCPTRTSRTPGRAVSPTNTSRKSTSPLAKSHSAIHREEVPTFPSAPSRARRNPKPFWKSPSCALLAADWAGITASASIRPRIWNVGVSRSASEFGSGGGSGAAGSGGSAPLARDAASAPTVTLSHPTSRIMPIPRFRLPAIATGGRQGKGKSSRAQLDDDEGYVVHLPGVPTERGEPVAHHLRDVRGRTRGRLPDDLPQPLLA